MKKTFTLLSILSASFAIAQDSDVLSRLKSSLNPGSEIISTAPSSIPGLIEVQVNSQIIYLTEDGTKVISGDIYDLKNKISLTEQAHAKIRANALTKIKDEDKIIYRAKKEKHKVAIFTDITCPYCTEAHKNVPKYNDLGITVEYFAYPRSGIGSQNAKNMQKIWCAEDKTTALTQAKIDRKLPKKECGENQVNEQFLMGRDIGIQATPTFVLKNGVIAPGLLSPEQLISILESQPK